MEFIQTVVTPASSKNLTARDTVRAELGLTGSGANELIDRYIAAASRAVVRYCSREFIAEQVQEEFRPFPFIDSASVTNLPEYVYLHRLPVTTITSFAEDEYPLVEGTDYEIDRTTGRVMRMYNDLAVRWWKPFRKLIAIYTGGYTFPDGTLEPDIESATIEIVKDMWFSRTRDPRIRSEDVAGVLSTNYWVGTINGSAWPPKVTELLAPWQGPMF